MSLRSPLSSVLGSGSAKDGTEHWWMQRVTAIALLIIGLWFLVSIASLADYDRAELYRWAGHPFNAVMLILASITLAWHSAIGVQVIVEDYVHGALLKVSALLLNKFFHVFLAAAAVLAVLKIALGALGDSL